MIITLFLWVVESCSRIHVDKFIYYVNTILDAERFSIFRNIFLFLETFKYLTSRIICMLNELFGSKIKVKILSEMGRRPYKEFYLNELSKTLKIGLGRTKTILDDMASSKVLEKRRSGNRILYKQPPVRDQWYC